MTKVLLISHIFPPAIDGGSRVIYKLGQYFKLQNFDILYLSSNCSSTDDFIKTSSVKGKVTPPKNGFIKLPVYHRLRRPLKFINLFIPKKNYLHGLLSVLQKGPIFKFSPFLKACIKIIKFKPDIIVAGPLPTTIVIYARFIKFITNTLTSKHPKLLINASFHPSDTDFHQIPLIHSLQQSDYLWTLSQFESDYFINHLHISPQKIILAGNGVDSEFVKKTSPTKPRQPTNLLFIGSISAHKGVDTLIKSFNHLVLNQNQTDLSLTIAGQKTLYYPIIKQQINKLNKSVSQKIKFVFNFPQNKLKELIDDTYVLILPSRHESFGLVIIEAWARGKPVIASDIPPLREIISQANGGLNFRLDDYRYLSSQIIKLIKSPSTVFTLGQNGKKYVKNNYLWTKVGQKICQKLLS